MIASSRLKILSLTTVYPNPHEPGHGVFVRARLQAIGALADVKVVAPLALLDYSNPHGKVFGRRRFAMWQRDQNPEVVYPRWVFPPFGTPINVLCLLFRLLPTLRRIRREFAFDVIDAHFGYPEGVAACLLAAVFRCPFTVTLRGSEAVPHADYRLRRLCMQWTFRRAARIFAVSPELRNFAISLGADPSRTKTVPNGIDRRIFYPRESLANRLKHGLDPDAHVIVSAGELVETKGHHSVIRAVKSLQDHGVRVQLVFAGKAGRGGADYEPALRRLAGELQCDVRFVGWVGPETLAELLSAADLFCLASYSEGWPNVVHEALSCGTPVVATRVGGIPHMICSDQYGFLVPVGDQAALDSAVATAIHKTWDRASISEWGRSRSWDSVAQEVVGEFRRLLARSDMEDEAQSPGGTASLGQTVSKIGDSPDVWHQRTFLLRSAPASGRGHSQPNVLDDASSGSG